VSDLRSRRLGAEQIEIAFSPGDEEVGRTGAAQAPDTVLGRLGVDIPPGESREFVYTDKGRARWSGEARGRNSSAYHGFAAGMWKYVEDWVLGLDEDLLTPEKIERVVVYPHKRVRHYAGGTVEEVFLCERMDALVAVFTTEFRGPFRFAPRFDIRHIWRTGRVSYRVSWQPKENVLLVSNAAADAQGDAPRWVGVGSSEALSFVEKAAYVATTYPKDARRGVLGEGGPYQAGVLKGTCTGGRLVFVFALGEEDGVADTARQVLTRWREHALNRAARIAEVVRAAPAGIQDSDLGTAVRWAAASLDSLAMNQQGPGLYAGLHWFPNYWSRDTFISLPALLCLGRFETSRDILLAALKGQVEDFRSNVYGRLPNLVSPGEVHYNTADGTWWFLRAAHQYVEYTGETRFAREILPGAIRAIEGEVKKRTDADGFSVHGDAETWMDAAKDGRAWSPRADRAVEVQALWYGALLSGADIAEWAGEGALGSEWRRRAGQVKERFLEKFWDPQGGCLFDHLDPDGRGDRKPRPNQVFALVVPPEPLLPDEKARAVLDFVVRHLVYPHGVGTLSEEDPDFKPRHIDLARYPFDAAYHNGDVWVWLSGIVMTALVRQGRAETAWRLMRALVALMKGEGAVGTLPELRNAVPPADGGPNVEGTVTQAWSLAELIRPLYQDFLGLRPRMVERRLEIEPALPEALGSVGLSLRVGEAIVRADCQIGAAEKRIRLELKGLAERLTVALRLRVPGGRRLHAEGKISAPGVLEFAAKQGRKAKWRVNLNGKPVSFETEDTPFDIAAERVPEFRTPAGPGAGAPKSG